jgi:hypothetical protein
MEYKEKLLSLMSGCLQDKRIFEGKTQFYQVVDATGDRHVSTYPEDMLQFSDGTGWNDYRVCRDKFKEHYFVKCENSRIKNKVEERYGEISHKKYYDNIDKSYRIIIKFNDQPPLELAHSTEIKSNQTLLPIFYERQYFFGLLGKKSKVEVTKNEVKYKPYYQIIHGNLKAKISDEEAEAFYELAKTNSDKFRQEAELKKLDERLKIYGK